MRRLPCIVLVLGVVVSLLPVVLHAEDDPRELEVRIYTVGALTMGRWSHLREQPPPISADMISDESRPLFGATAEEPQFPYGTIDELLELVLGGVEPNYWFDQPGAGMRVVGDAQILVRASPRVHARVRSFLDALQRSAGRTATVELQWRGVPAEIARELLPTGGDAALLDAERAARLLEAGEAGPAVSVTCYSGQLAAVTGGRQIAWIQDGDVEFAQEATCTDPIVTVSNLGFLAQVRPLLSAETALLGIDAVLAELEDMPRVPTERNGRFETPVFHVVNVRPVLRVPYGRWAVAEGRRAPGGDRWWLLLVRVHDHAYETTSGLDGDATIELGSPTPYGEAPMALRMFDVGDLGVPVGHRRGEHVFLWPSIFTPRGWAELAEPQPTISPDELVELTRTTADDEVWEDPASIEVRNWMIIARNTPRVLSALERHLGEIREKAMWSVVTTAEVLEVPEPFGARLAHHAVLDEDALRELAEMRASGRAETLGALRLTNYRDAMNFVRAGEAVTYLQDFEVEIAQAAEIGNPIFWDVFSGAQLDLQAGRSPDGGSIQLNVGFIRTDVERPLRTQSTTHGHVQLPEMEVFRARTAVQVPDGRTVLAATWHEDGRRRLLLLTPRLR